MKQIIQSLDTPVATIAADVCAQDGLDFYSLDARAVRGLISYWCSTCSRIYPLSDLSVSPRRTKCGHCLEPVRLYSNSNKFGKLRRSVFYKLIDVGMIKLEK
jgi:DNA-directed RNA polymerase subunit RPC12/RpoP